MEFYLNFLLGFLMIFFAFFVRRKNISAMMDFAEDKSPFLVSKSFRVRFWGSLIFFFLPFVLLIGGVVFLIMGILKFP